MPRVRMDWRRCVVVAACVGLLVADGALAEIYRWVDANGKMHFTQDLASVPPAYRAEAKARAEGPKKEIEIQTYDPPVPSTRRTTRAQRSAGRKRGGRVHTIRVESAGSSMYVKVRLNDQLDVPFVIDTGATGVALPLSVAKELGLELEGDGVRKVRVGTANGSTESSVVMLDSVQLGTARVENIPGFTLKKMKYGLLGLSFFNHFNYNIDATRGIVTLTENNLAEDGVLRGGRSKSGWIGQFRGAQRAIEQAEEKLDEVPFGRSRERAAWEERIADLKNRLRLLEAEADEARVPFSWRD